MNHHSKRRRISSALLRAWSWTFCVDFLSLSPPAFQHNPSLSTLLALYGSHWRWNVLWSQHILHSIPHFMYQFGNEWCKYHPLTDACIHHTPTHWLGPVSPDYWQGYGLRFAVNCQWCRLLPLFTHTFMDAWTMTLLHYSLPPPKKSNPFTFSTFSL